MIFFDLNFFLYGLLAVIAILALWIFRLERRISRLLRGKNAANLEDTFNTFSVDLKSIKHSIIMIAKELESMDARIKRNIGWVKTVRFNPFKTEGGNQSFATALLDEEGNGVVISSLYSRDKTSVYAKPVKNLASEYELTREEREVIGSL